MNETKAFFKLVAGAIAVLAIVAIATIVFGPKPARASIIIEGTTESLELVTSSTSTVHYSVSYVETTSSAAEPNGLSSGSITTATDTTILSAPAASTQRQVKQISVRNVGTAAQTIVFQRDVSGTEYELFEAALQPNEQVALTTQGEWIVYDSAGRQKTAVDTTAGLDGISEQIYKVGAASEAAGLFYGHAKDTGRPGAWVPGTPGLNGDALSCSTTADATIAGSPLLADPASGSWFLTTFNVASTTGHLHGLVDLIWYNTGLVVTTTTAQNITLPTLPNRDRAGTANGDGWLAAIYVTTATTNAGAITNTTLSYTDQDGNAGNTATISSFPATAVAGAFVPFQLAAGDRGIQNIASITLGTSYVTGAISLVLYRPLVYAPSPVANIGGSLLPLDNHPTGIKLFSGTCVWPIYLASATTATNTSAVYTLVNR